MRFIEHNIFKYSSTKDRGWMCQLFVLWNHCSHCSESIGWRTEKSRSMHIDGLAAYWVSICTNLPDTRDDQLSYKVFFKVLKKIHLVTKKNENLCKVPKLKRWSPSLKYWCGWFSVLCKVTFFIRSCFERWDQKGLHCFA